MDLTPEDATKRLVARVQDARDVINELLARLPAPTCYEQAAAVDAAIYWLDQEDNDLF